MFKAHALLVVALLSIGGSPSSGEAVARAMVEVEVETSPIAIEAATPEQEAMVEWALARFAEAGLELPPMTITFSPSTAGCRGFIGYYSRAASQLDICNAGGLRTEPIHTVIHELAHAWSFAQLPSEDRQRWSQHRGLDSWHDDTVAWWQQGKEQAAEVVAWGLMSDTEPFSNRWVMSEQCEDLAVSFRLLTGIDPLNTANHSCR